MDLSGDTINPYLYEHDTNVKVEDIVDALKNKTQLKTKLVCSSGEEFSPFGKPMIEDKPDSVLCSRCAFTKAHNKRV